jgi:hypothetical protein
MPKKAPRKTEAQKMQERQDRIIIAANKIVKIVRKEQRITIGELIARTGYSAYLIWQAWNYIQGTVDYIDMDTADGTLFIKKKYKEMIKKEEEEEEKACREAEKMAKELGVEI